jgi:hypothetical protein
MYGVPADLDLKFLHGALLIQVCLGQHQVQFHFHPVGSISVEGGWELRDATGEWMDGTTDGSDRPPCKSDRILGGRVVGTELSAPKSFSLKFEGGEVLRVFDDSEQFESFSIQPGNIFV